jgi:hypothetical protein
VLERSQKCLYFFFVLKSGVVGTNGYFQGPQNRAREFGLSRAETTRSMPKQRNFTAT